MQSSTAAGKERFPVVLGAAIVQGWALFGLHHAITHQHWPATELSWLFALYPVCVLAPLTVQLLVERAARAETWVIVATMTLVLFYFGWHHGSAVAGYSEVRFAESGECFPLAIVLSVWWLLVMPFIQARLEHGRWRAGYGPLFEHAWRNAIKLAEAGLFTGIFWLLLFLWQSLFHMLQIDFFRELFEKPIFVYPVTSIVFGCALQLIGSVERLVSTVLEQVLSVFKWLGTVTAALLALFTLALVARLPGLVFTGERAIGAVWMLWLVAVVVLFLNAAYRDGSASSPYPRWIALLLRVVAPLTVIVSLTALYALIVRMHEYGLTVGRFWGFVVAVAAMCYSVGYAAAGLRRGPWFGAVAPVNVMVAVLLIVVLSVALTPLLSPFRLAARSQYNLILRGRDPSVHHGYSARNDSPYHYLRFSAGAYGRQRLDQLLQLQDHPDAVRIRELAKAALEEKNPWQAGVDGQNARAALAGMTLYPAGHPLDPELVRKLSDALNDPRHRYLWSYRTDLPMAGVFAKLGAGDAEQFVLIDGGVKLVFAHDESGWHQVGGAGYPESRVFAPQKDIVDGVAAGEVVVKDPQWKELWIKGHRITVD